MVTVLLSGGAPAALYLSWATYRLGAEQAQDQAAEVSLAEVADSLADAVHAQWQAEARARRLYDPYPLPIRWEPVEESLVEGWDALVASASRSDSGRAARESWAAGPAALADISGELAVVLARIPTRRLVVLGGPGSGKTMLMVQLVLDLLAARKSGEPVPVLVSAASWDPGTQDLRGWLEAVLSIDYPVLADPARSAGIATTRVGALLEHGLIVPIMDGLDEIPDAARGPAIARINDAFEPGQQFVVTCRTVPFKEAVRPDGGIEVTLRGAAGIELCPLNDSTVADYLRADAGGPAGARRWEAVLDTLGTAAPLAQVLSTPLMAGLARIIYNPRPGERTGTLRDPGELNALSDTATIEGHLLDAFISAAYRPIPSSPDRQSERYAEHSKRWLTFLAKHLEDNVHGTDFVWWQLSKATPRLVTCLATGLAAGLASILAIEVIIPLTGLIYYGLSSNFFTAFNVAIAWMANGLRFALAAGLASGLIVGIAARVATASDKVTPEWSNHHRRLLIIAAFACISGLMICVAIWSELNPPALWLAAIGLISAGVIGWNMYTVQRRGVELNLSKGALAGIAVGVVLGFTFMVVVGYFGGAEFGVRFGITFGIISGFASGLAALIVDAAGQSPSRAPRWNVNRGSRAAGSAAIVSGLGSWYAFQSTTFGIVFALAFGVAAGVIVGLESAPSDLAVAASPKVLRARDRSTTLVLTLATAVAGGVAAGLVCGVLYGSRLSLVGAASMAPGGLLTGLAFGLAFATGTGLAVALIFSLAISVFGLAWPQWVVIRGWLTLRGSLPIDLDKFLADAHKRGVLRQVGAAYQFRHVELQHWLGGISHQRIIPASPSDHCTIRSDLPITEAHEPHPCPMPETGEAPIFFLRRIIHGSPLQGILEWIAKFANKIRLQRSLIILGFLAVYSAAAFSSLLLTGILPITSRSQIAQFSGLLPTATAPVTSPLASHGRVTVTKHLVFEPWGVDGLARGISIAVTVTGSCWAQSEDSSRPDAYRCMSGDYIFDPCIANEYDLSSANPEVACPYPGITNVTIIKLSAPLLLQPAAAPANPPISWLVVLPNNNECYFADGTADFVNGMRANYYCPNGRLFGNVRYGIVWSILYQPNGASAMTAVSIVATYS